MKQKILVLFVDESQERIQSLLDKGWCVVHCVPEIITPYNRRNAKVIFILNWNGI